MRPFTLARADTLDAALDELQAPGTMAIAGGTELLNWLKEGIVGPDRLLDISRLPLTGIGVGPDGLVIGALARMSDVAAHRAVATGYPVLGAVAAAGRVRAAAQHGHDRRQPDAAHPMCLLPGGRAAALQPASRPGRGCAARDGRYQRARHLRRDARTAWPPTHPTSRSRWPHWTPPCSCVGVRAAHGRRWPTSTDCPLTTAATGTPRSSRAS